jgi:hypothetical protein
VSTIRWHVVKWLRPLSREHARPASAKSSDPRVAGLREVDREQLGCFIASTPIRDDAGAPPEKTLGNSAAPARNRIVGPRRNDSQRAGENVCNRSHPCRRSRARLTPQEFFFERVRCAEMAALLTFSERAFSNV